MSDVDKFFISEFDSAKQPLHWATLGQDFYAVAKIIDEEFDEAMNWMNNGHGKVVPLRVSERIHGRIAATYCMAIALELVVKAAYLQEKDSKTMKPSQFPDFSNLSLIELVNDITRVHLSVDESNEIKKAQEIIVEGKYPAPIKPSDSKEYWHIPSLKRTIEKLEPIYLKYKESVIKHQKDK